MSAKNPLQRLAVKSPCSQDWGSMIGNDRVRFCEHCSLHVQNISEMTRAEALRLARRSNGRICVRYNLSPSQEIVTRRPGSRRINQIGRRVSRIASGAFSATLSVSSAFAEPAAPAQVNTPVISSVLDRRYVPPAGGSITGTVMDQNSAVIVSASVVLTDPQTQLQMTTSTNDAGEFRFDGLAAASYTLRVTAAGFTPYQMTEVKVDSAQGAQVVMTMSVSSETVTVGAMVIPGPDNPLVRAAQNDDMEELQALIGDADVNVRDHNTGTTALDHAVRNGNHEMVQFLIGRGADVNASEDGGFTALMELDEEATPELMWTLINAGAKVNHKTSYGQTALMSVASRNNSEVLEELLAAGANVNLADEDGKTALIIAASEGLVLNVRLLVLAGANINATDSDGKNALMHAIENEHKTVIRFLKSKGAVEAPPKKDKEEKEGDEN